MLNLVVGKVTGRLKKVKISQRIMLDAVYPFLEKVQDAYEMLFRLQV